MALPPLSSQIRAMRIIPVLIAVVVAVVLQHGSARETFAHSDQYVLFIAQHSFKCTDVTGGGTGNGALIRQWTCDGTADQEFQVTHTADGWHEIKFRHSGKCLDVPGASTSDGVQLVQWQCNGQNNQRFAVASCSGCTGQLVAKHSGKCMDVYNASTSDGAAVIQYWCHGAANQQWRMRDTYVVGHAPFGGYWGNASLPETHPSRHHLVECEPEQAGSYDQAFDSGYCNDMIGVPGGDWSLDYYNVPGTQVKFSAHGTGTPQANITAQVWAIASTCGGGPSVGGRTVFVDVYANGRWEGWYSFGHLDAVQVSPLQWINPGKVLGTLRLWDHSDDCWDVWTNEGVHSHIEMWNQDYSTLSDGFACYRGYTFGGWMAYLTELGHIGRTKYTSLRAQCGGTP